MRIGFQREDIILTYRSQKQGPESVTFVMVNPELKELFPSDDENTHTQMQYTLRLRVS